MGLSITPSSHYDDAMSPPHYRTHRGFLFCNYALLGLASGCAFLTLSLRLLPTLPGLAFILLHALTAAGAIAACVGANAPSRTGRWYAAHMVATVLAAIFQGAGAVLVYTRTPEFLGELGSYVREDDGAVILRMAGGLGIAIFCLEWVAMGLAFALRYYSYVDGESCGAGGRSCRVGDEQAMKELPWSLQTV